MKKCVCGALTGMTAGGLTHPLDLIRTHLAINCKNYDRRSIEKPTMLRTGLGLYKSQGVPGLFKGLNASFV